MRSTADLGRSASAFSRRRCCPPARDAEGDVGAALGEVRSRSGAAMGGGDLRDDGEAEAGAGTGARLVGPAEARKGAGDELGGKPGPVSMTWMVTAPPLESAASVIAPPSL